jgi:hypothetical protein
VADGAHGLTVDLHVRYLDVLASGTMDGESRVESEPRVDGERRMQ